MDKIPSPYDVVGLEGVHQFSRMVKPCRSFMLLHGMAVGQKSEANRL